MLDNTFWNKYFITYDILIKSIPYQELINDIENQLDFKKEDTILDIGSGTGNIAVALERKNNVIITGIDYSETGMAIHRQKNPRAHVIHHDLNFRLPFENGSFDKVYSNNTLYTFPKKKQIEIMKEVHRIMKQGGIFVISNIKKNFKPYKVLAEHVKMDISRRNFRHVLLDVTKYFIPILKMFYYNWKIKKENSTGSYFFVSENDQIEILKKAGFVEIEKKKDTYANLAVMFKSRK